MEKFRLSKKGVSIVLVTLLMIVVAASASILVYVWVTGFIGKMQGSGGQQVRDRIIMEAYEAEDSSAWTLHLRNVGTAVLSISAVYVSGNPVSFSGVTTYGPGESSTLTLDVSALSLQNGRSYLVKVVTSDGAVFPYSVIYGSQA